jgi:hypothetical protein
MQTKFAQLSVFVSKFDRRYLQLAFALLALVLLVLGAGAPEDGGHGMFR